ncbi:MAG: tRNA (N(6)-L-threonylcarbamoyladenosine(37)-C(2))-methylthiotransferase MtaB [Candidatus Algichlamydia australiensis]|nr:tRNA (N(6)-L-threonylcarbamoyladenosine(37)-C(2))-methylthiotransferase MtaB [Chlamydiales bacterium]
MHQKKFTIATLGCRTNQYESQAYTDQLEAAGFVQAKKGEEAGVCIVNTCTVTQSADGRSFAAIRKLMRNHPNAKIVVTGCMAEREKQKIESIDPKIQVVGNNEKEHLLELALPEVENFPEFSIKNFEAHTRAFVKIQDGCNSYCSYCIIPYVRGRSRCKDRKVILQEVKDLIANGYKEIVLTGINIGDFEGLASLVREIDQMEGLRRLRLSSIDPDEVDEELLRAIIDGKRTCKSMHIVLQAGSNVVLKRMRRKYTREEFFDTVHRLRAAHPDFTFTTDVIVGFPGETEEDHAETLDVISQVRFAKVHMFPYSDRPKTRSARMPNKVPKAMKEKRRQEVMRKAEKVAFDMRKEYVGRVMDVLLEGEDPLREGYIRGHTDNFLLVSLPKEGVRSNEIVSVKLEKNEPDCLVGTHAN